MDLILTFGFCLFILAFFCFRLLGLYSISSSKSLKTEFKTVFQELYLNKLSDTYAPKLEDVISISDFYQSILEDKIWNTNYKTLQKTGNTLTGLGILGTFVGLYWGLSEIEFNNISTESILPLINGMSTAFITSICGMSLSLLYSSILNSHISKLEKQFYNICSEYNSKNIESPTYYLKKQADALANLGGGIGSSIGAEVADALNKNLSTLISNLDKKMAGMIENIERLLSETLSNELRNASEGIHKAADIIRVSTGEFRESTQEMHKVITKSVDMLNDVDKLSVKVASIVKNVEGLAENINSELGDAALQVQFMTKSLKEAFEESNKLHKVIASLDETIVTLNTYSSVQEEIIKDLCDNFSKNIGPKLSDLTVALDKFPETLPTAEKLFVAINEGVNEYANKLKEKTDLLLNKFTDEFTKACVAVENTAQAIHDSKDTIYTAINDYNKNIDKVKVDHVDRVRNSYDLLISDIEGFSKSIRGVLQNISKEVEK